jgi:hypothetical protein
MLGVLGCGPDNETEADKLAKTAGDPGAANPKAISDAKEAPPATQEEFGKRALEAQKNALKQGYPGVKKK